MITTLSAKVNREHHRVKSSSSSAKLSEFIINSSSCGVCFFWMRSNIFANYVHTQRLGIYPFVIPIDFEIPEAPGPNGGPKTRTKPEVGPYIYHQGCGHFSHYGTLMFQLLILNGRCFHPGEHIECIICNIKKTI
jgi:hypothetical protein